MGQRVAGEGWCLVVPDRITGGPLEHSHTHLETMTLYRGVADGQSDLEVIVTTYAGEPIGEHGERLDRDGEPCAVPGALVATRREQITRLDIDPAIPPVRSTVVVATAPDGASVCLVVHRPIDSPTTWSDPVVESLVLGQAQDPGRAARPSADAT